MSLPPAYQGRILRVDLTSGKIAKSTLSRELAMMYVGGKGVGTRLLYDEVKPGIDPLGPENKLIFNTGPATGTSLPNKGYIVCFKSPQTNAYSSSNSGGFFGAELKMAGYDALIVEGQSNKPVYLWIDDQQVEIKDAKSIWGKDTFETDDIIKEQLGDSEIKTARIGPAGENLVRFASIVNDHSRTAGRAGAGCVAGSKQLKAIAVRGTGQINVADVDKLLQLTELILSKIKSTKATSETYPKWGTPAGVNVAQMTGVFPTKYWHEGVFSGYEKINAEKMKNDHVVKDKACYSCAVRCSKLSQVDQGPYAGSLAEGPDYETIYSLGSLALNDGLDVIIKANEICDRLGMDTISAGNVIAFSMDCYDRGILTTKDTDGVPLEWGDKEAIIKTLEKIAIRKGLGNLLADGLREAARKLGKDAEYLAIHVKGLEPAGYDPRGMKGVALSIGVGDRGACHMPSSIYTYEMRGETNRSSYEGKGAFLKGLDERFALSDCMIFCRFNRDIYSWETIVSVFPPLLGYEIGVPELMKIGQRVVTLARAYNSREGLRRKDDYPPLRLFQEPIPNGPSKGHVLNKPEYDKMLDEYYQFKGWDRDGVPSTDKLVELELKDVAGEMSAILKDEEKSKYA